MVEKSEQNTTAAHRLDGSPLDGCVRKSSVAGSCALQSRVQLSQTSCYLCSAWLDDKDVEEHLRVCREQKIVCPDGCGSFVARKVLQLHSNRCPQSFDGTAPTDRFEMNPPSSLSKPGSATSCIAAYQQLQQEINAMKLAIQEQSVKYSSAMKKIDQLKQKLTYQPRAGPTNMRNRQQQTQQNLIQPLPQDQPQNQLQLLPQSQPLNLIQPPPQQQPQNQRKPPPKYQPHNQLQLPPQPQPENQLQLVPHQQPQNQRQPPSNYQPQNQLLPQQQSQNQLQLQPQCQPQPGPSVCQLLAGPDLRLTSALAFAEQKVNISTLLYTVKDTQVRQYEQEERQKQLENKVERYRVENLYTKRRLDELAALVNRKPIEKKEGRVLWYIDNFSARLRKASENNHTMNGQIFLCNVLGYFMQVNISLNGLGNYRGTHMTVTVSVSPGPYDGMLDWPMQANLRIKVYDQTPDYTNAEDMIIEKTLNWLSPGGAQPAYFHILHQTLATRNFILRDTVVLCVDIEIVHNSEPQPGPAAQPVPQQTEPAPNEGAPSTSTMRAPPQSQ